VKNLVNCQHLLFTETWRHSKFGGSLCKICWEKHPRAFVKVVEGSEICNFPIHHFVHFYSNFWSIFRSNRASWNGWRRAATSRRPARRARPAAPYTRTEQARDPRSECVPREVPLRHVEPSPSPAGRTPRYPSVRRGPPLRVHADWCRSPYRGLKAGYSFTRGHCHSPVFPRAIKRPTRPSRVHMSGGFRSRRTAIGAPTASSPSACSQGRTNPLSSSPHASTLSRVVSSRALPPSSPVRKQSRPEPPCACWPSSPELPRLLLRPQIEPRWASGRAPPLTRPGAPPKPVDSGKPAPPLGPGTQLHLPPSSQGVLCNLRAYRWKLRSSRDLGESWFLK
jgi:hypothetical protein